MGPSGSGKTTLLNMGDYSNAFDGIAGWLSQKGVTTYAFDQRGFGTTTTRGYWPGTQTMVGDLKHDAVGEFGFAVPPSKPADESGCVWPVVRRPDPGDRCSGYRATLDLMK